MTIRRVTQKKPVPTRLARDLAAAAEQLDKATVERDRLVVKALRGGASIREIAEVANISHATVARIGRDAGWPDAAELKRREDAQKERYRWWPGDPPPGAPRG